MTLIVDPPEGWRYGFPKAVPEGLHEDVMGRQEEMVCGTGLS